jgi:hypothetical protein
MAELPSAALSLEMRRVTVVVVLVVAASAWSAAGGVAHGSAGGLTGTGSQLFSQNSPGVPGNAEDDDVFGDALAAGDPGPSSASGSLGLQVKARSEKATSEVAILACRVHQATDLREGLTGLACGRLVGTMLGSCYSTSHLSLIAQVPGWG